MGLYGTLGGKKFLSQGYFVCYSCLSVMGGWKSISIHEHNFIKQT